jgi:Holliday junction DNA helicase RuvB
MSEYKKIYSQEAVLSQETSGRLTSGHSISLDEDSSNTSLRPKLLDDFIGQKQLRQNLRVFIEAASARGDALDHVLLHGPPGLGKTTLSQIIANELGVGFKVTSGPILSKAGDLAAILTNLQKHEVLFIDEIHRLSPTIEEVLYPAMEDYAIDVIIGSGPAARTVKINLPKFTLIGATTRLGMLSNPLRDRFGIPMKLNFYNQDELYHVIKRGAQILNLTFTEEALAELAKCARGTPRIAVRLLRRVRDFVDFRKETQATLEIVRQTLDSLGIDELGLDGLDYKYMLYVAENYQGGPVGIDTIAAGLSEDRDTLEDTVEPYLMQIGFLARTPRGRTLTLKCLQHINFPIDPAKYKEIVEDF